MNDNLERRVEEIAETETLVTALRTIADESTDADDVRLAYAGLVNTSAGRNNLALNPPLYS